MTASATATTSHAEHDDTVTGPAAPHATAPATARPKNGDSVRFRAALNVTVDPTVSYDSVGWRQGRTEGAEP